VTPVEVMFRGDPRQAVAAAEETAAAIRGVGETSAVTNAEAGKLERGILAGSGAFRGLGRSVAYASGAFLAAAGLVGSIKGAVDESEKLEKAQRSLDAAIEHTGGNVAAQRPLYDATAKAAAQYGVSQADATTELSRALLLTGDSTKAQHAYQEALVISKATGKDFNSVLTATAKGQDGVTTSLQRYGIEIPKGTSGQKQFNEVMGRFGDQARANTTNMDKLRANAANLGAELGGPLLKAVNYLAGSLSDLITWLQSPAVSGALDNFRDQFMAHLQPIIDWFQQNWPEIKQVIIETVQDAWTVVKDTIAVFQAGWRVFGGTIKTIARNDFSAIAHIIEDIVRVVRGVVEIVKGIAHGDWSLAWHGIKDVVGGAVDAIYRLLRAAAGNLAAIAKLIGTAIYNGILEPIGHLAAHLLSVIKNAISGAIHTVAGWVVGAAAAIGRAIASGILSGIGDLGSSLAHKLRGAASGALGDVKGFLHIGSPSRVFADEVGAPIGQGILSGFLREIAPFSEIVRGSLTPMVSSGRRMVTPALAGGLSATTAGFPVSPGPTYNIHVTSLASTSRGVAQELGRIVKGAPGIPAIHVVAR
jgi:hypothetical protein